MRLRPLFILGSSLLTAPLGGAAEAAALPTLTVVRQVSALSESEAARSYPVRLRGTLTFHDWELSFLQDASGGIFFRNIEHLVPAGTEVEIEGFTQPGRTIPIVTGPGPRGGQARIRSLGTSQWPEPVRLAAGALDQGIYDARWVSVRGVVTNVARVRDGIMLDLLSDGLLVQAAIPRWPQNWALPGYLRDQTCTVRGVVARKPVPLDGDLGPTKTVLCVPSLEMVEIAPEGLAARFDRPRQTYQKLFPSSSWDKPLVRIYGQARFARPGQGFYLFMENTANVWVQTSAPGKITPGDFVDAVGWSEIFDGRVVLTDAVFRLEKSAPPAPRLTLTVSDIESDTVGYHGAAITVEGRLVEQQRNLAEDSLVVEDRDILFLVRRPLLDGSKSLPVLERGTLLRLGGVCQTKRLPLQENMPATFAFQLWLTSATDVEVLQLPPWWTVQRVFILCGAILILGLLAAGWAALLRRQVARQTAVIGQQREREAVAEERARIARELHDSLGQELVGIALQLDSAAARITESPQQAERALDMARMMVRHSQAETKRSVEDLRAHELSSTDLPAALDELVQPLIAATGSAQISLKLEGPPRRLAGIMEHHLLRMGQEAIANAVRHAQASRIEVRVRYDEREVMLEVKDDGRGFDPSEALATAAGHFGLLGLRERANKLQGRLRIESKSGAGTLISVTVPTEGDSRK